MILDPGKLLIILVVAFVVLGPEKLPDLMRHAGKYWAMATGFRDTLNSQIASTLGPLEGAASAVRGATESPMSRLYSALTATDPEVAGPTSERTQDTGGTSADTTPRSFTPARDDHAGSRVRWITFADGSPELN